MPPRKACNWAGDLDRLVGRSPLVGTTAVDLLGTSLQDLIGSKLLIAGDEAIHVNSLEPFDKGLLSVVVSRTGPFISVELEPATNLSSAVAVLERVRSVSDRISAMSSLPDAYDAAVAHVRAISGFDHVMIYKFLADGSGAVVAEARGPDVTALMNHRFPASDIPAQARELYRRN